MKTYTYFTDPGHGWLKVPADDLVQLHIEDKVSYCSYISPSGKFAYLEEDCDAPMFEKAYKALIGCNLKVQQRNSPIRPSTIRNMVSYNKKYLNISQYLR